MARHDDRKARIGRGPLVLAVVMLAVAAGTVGAVRIVADREPPAPSCTAPVGVLSVGAAEEAVPWLSEVAADYTAGRRVVAGRCVVVQVRPLTFQQAAAALVPDADGGPDVWVPQSSTELALLRATPAGKTALTVDAPPVAVSPLVLAGPPAAMRLLRAAGGRTDVQFGDLLPLLSDPRGWGQPGLDSPEWGPIRLSTLDPGRTGLGASVLSALVGVLTRTPAPEVDADDYRSAPAREGLLGVSRAFGATPAVTADLLRPVGEASTADEVVTSVGLVAAYEQDVWRHDADTPAVLLDAAYPLDGQLAADHPYVVPKAPWVDAADRAAAADFLGWLLSAGAQGRLDRFGLRRADGVAGQQIGIGLRVGAVPPMASKPPTVLDGLTAAQSTWRTLVRRVSLLALFDVSGSMAEPVPGSAKSKLDVAREAAQTALGYFDPRDSIGLWEFSRQLAGEQDYRVLVPLGPAGEPVGTYPDRWAASVAAYQGMRPRTATGLYDSLLAAYRGATTAYRADAMNTVVVISDGANEDAGSITLEALLAELKTLYDPARPVHIVTLAYGTGADPGVLTQIARATGGLEFDAPDPRTIGTVFTRAITALSR